MSFKVCSFTGHRPQNLPFGFNEGDKRCIFLKKILQKKIEMMITKYGVKHFISGMAIGVDMYAAEIVLSLKKKYPDITLECAVPCENQSSKWSEALKKRYDGIIGQCDKKTVLQKYYTKDCMQKRNKYMVDNSDFVIAVWDGTPSGTGKTVQYAKTLGKLIIIVNPENPM